MKKLQITKTIFSFPTFLFLFLVISFQTHAQFITTPAMIDLLSGEIGNALPMEQLKQRLKTTHPIAIAAGFNKPSIISNLIRLGSLVNETPGDISWIQTAKDAPINRSLLGVVALQAAAHASILTRMKSDLSVSQATWYKTLEERETWGDALCAISRVEQNQAAVIEVSNYLHQDINRGLNPLFLAVVNCGTALHK